MVNNKDTDYRLFKQFMSYAMSSLYAAHTYPLEPVMGNEKLILFFRRFIEEYYQTQDAINDFLSLNTLRAAFDVLISQSVEVTVVLDSQGSRRLTTKEEASGFPFLLPVWRSESLSFEPRLTIMKVSKDRQRVIRGEAKDFPILNIVPHDFLDQAELLDQQRSDQGSPLNFDENLIFQLDYYRGLLGLAPLSDRKLWHH